MIWGWMIYTIKENKVFFILIVTIIINLVVYFSSWPIERAIHPATYIEGEGVTMDSHEGMYYNWHAWINSNYINFIIILFLPFFKMSSLDKDAHLVYIFFTFWGYFSYRMIGWPEPKIPVIIAYCALVAVFVGLRIWRLSR